MVGGWEVSAGPYPHRAFGEWRLTSSVPRSPGEDAAQGLGGPLRGFFEKAAQRLGKAGEACIPNQAQEPGQ